jgi:hypothetical protein
VFVLRTPPKTRPHLRERAVNRRVQGDLGEFSAMEWLASKGALVWIPLGHSPDVDLMAELDGRLLRIQVKTSTYRTETPNGHGRWQVAIATSGGNQSWSGAAKKFDASRVEYLFVLSGDGRRWFIPASVVEGARAILLGGAKYSEFEIERGSSLESLVYPDGNTNRIATALEGECQSGQMDQTVNLTAMPTVPAWRPVSCQETVCGSGPMPLGGSSSNGSRSERRPTRRPATSPTRPRAELSSAR